MNEFIGFNPPFIGGNEKIMSQQRGSRLVRNDVLHNLMIAPGELPFRPNFGTNIRNFVFDAMKPSELGILEDEIRQQIVRNDSRLMVKDVTLTPYQDSGKLDVTVIVAFTEDPFTDIEINRLININSRRPE
jgi:phage baseplate assembly protein W